MGIWNFLTRDRLRKVFHSQAWRNQYFHVAKQDFFLVFCLQVLLSVFKYKIMNLYIFGKNHLGRFGSFSIQSQVYAKYSQDKIFILLIFSLSFFKISWFYISTVHIPQLTIRTIKWIDINYDGHQLSLLSVRYYPFF